MPFETFDLCNYLLVEMKECLLCLKRHSLLSNIQYVFSYLLGIPKGIPSFAIAKKLYFKNDTFVKNEQNSKNSLRIANFH